MFEQEYKEAAKGAKNKLAFLQNRPGGYFLASMLAGAFIGFGVMLAYSAGGYMSQAMPALAKIAMGATFGVALSLVVAAGAELFTGNNFVMAAGALCREVRWPQVFWLWLVCYIGNFFGSVAAGGLFYFAGLATGPVGEYMAASAAIKMHLPVEQMLFRGILCNVLVCLAVWCSLRLKNEAAKLIMVFWCLFTFITAGFEHSIANMTLFTITCLAPNGANISLAGGACNLLLVSVGNVVGGVIFTALPYYVISRPNRNKSGS